VELIYFVLAAHGLTQILIYGSIFDRWRPNHHFFHCSMCVGFWSAAFLFGINSLTELFSFNYSISNLLVLSCLGSGTSYMLSKTFGDSGINVNIVGEKND